MSRGTVTYKHKDTGAVRTINTPNVDNTARAWANMGHTIVSKNVEPAPPKTTTTKKTTPTPPKEPIIEPEPTPPPVYHDDMVKIHHDGGATFVRAHQVDTWLAREDLQVDKIVHAKTGHVFWEPPTEAEVIKQYKTEYKETGVVPDWAREQIDVPPEVKQLGLDDRYIRSAYEEYLGVKPITPEHPPGFIGPVYTPPIGMTAFEQEYKRATVYDKSWVEQHGVFKVDDKTMTYAELKKAQPAVVLKYTPEGYIPVLDIDKWYRDFYKDTGVTGDVHRAAGAAMGVFDVGVWSRAITEGPAEAGKYIREREYRQITAIQQAETASERLKAWAMPQADAYTTAIVPLATGATFKFVAAPFLKAGTVALTTKGAAIAAKGATITGKTIQYSPYVMKGVTMSAIGAKIGATAAFEEAGRVPEGTTLKMGVQTGMFIAGAVGGPTMKPTTAKALQATYQKTYTKLPGYKQALDYIHKHADIKIAKQMWKADIHRPKPLDFIKAKIPRPFIEHWKAPKVQMIEKGVGLVDKRLYTGPQQKIYREGMTTLQQILGKKVDPYISWGRYTEGLTLEISRPSLFEYEWIPKHAGAPQYTKRFYVDPKTGKAAVEYISPKKLIEPGRGILTKEGFKQFEGEKLYPLRGEPPATVKTYRYGISSDLAKGKITFKGWRGRDAGEILFAGEKWKTTPLRFKQYQLQDKVVVKPEPIKPTAVTIQETVKPTIKIDRPSPTITLPTKPASYYSPWGGRGMYKYLGDIDYYTPSKYWAGVAPTHQITPLDIKTAHIIKTDMMVLPDIKTGLHAALASMTETGLQYSSMMAQQQDVKPASLHRIDTALSTDVSLAFDLSHIQAQAQKQEQAFMYKLKTLYKYKPIQPPYKPPFTPQTPVYKIHYKPPPHKPPVTPTPPLYDLKRIDTKKLKQYKGLYDPALIGYRYKEYHVPHLKDLLPNMKNIGW
jgi:hypothetical protein